MESYFECLVLSSLSFFENVIHLYVVNMEQAITFYNGEKMRSCTISFKLEVVDFALKKSISNIALKYKIDRHSICVWKKKERVTRILQLS